MLFNGFMNIKEEQLRLEREQTELLRKIYAEFIELKSALIKVANEL